MPGPPSGTGSGAGLTAYVLRTGKPVLVDQAYYETLIEAGEVASVGADSLDWIGIPLRSEGVTLGVLAVQTYDENVRFDEKDRDVLARVGQHVAAALERVRLHEETRQHLRELKAVNRIGQALTAQLDLDGLVSLIGALVEEIFSADITYVAFLEAESISFPFYSEKERRASRPACRSATGRHHACCVAGAAPATRERRVRGGRRAARRFRRGIVPRRADRDRRPCDRRARGADAGATRATASPMRGCSRPSRRVSR